MIWVGFFFNGRIKDEVGSNTQKGRASEKAESGDPGNLVNRMHVLKDSRFQKV